MNWARIREGVTIAVIAGILGYGANALLTTRDNRIAIENLDESLNKTITDSEEQLRAMINNKAKELEVKIEGIRNSSSSANARMENLMVFVAQAHPDRDATLLTSVEKLQKMKLSEAKSLRKYLALTTDVADSAGWGETITTWSLPEDLNAIMEKYDIAEADLQSYRAVAENLRDAEAIDAYGEWGWSPAIEEVFFAGELDTSGGELKKLLEMPAETEGEKLEGSGGLRIGPAMRDSEEEQLKPSE